jgi:hypothetical protein
MFSNTKKFVAITLALFVFFNFYCLGSAQTPPPVTENVSVSAIVSSGLPTIDPGGGGSVYQSGVRFSGLAYPRAIVTVLKRDGVSLTTVADSGGKFTLFVPENNWQLFTLFATDVAGRKSTLLNFPTILYNGIITDISGIRFAPTITTDKLAVKKDDFVTIEGASLPRVTVEVVFEGQENRVFSLESTALGVYNVTVPAFFPEGEYTLRSRYVGDTRTSKAVKLTIGTASILRTEASTNIPGDCNFDQQVTLVDFSVLAFWYGKSNPPKCVDANGDGIINLVDFSILAFYWNG